MADYEAFTPRYLVSFHPKHIPHFFADILVIGGGLAGMRAANAVADDQSVLLVTKDRLENSNSHFAQGGIAGVLDAQDCFDFHVDDTIDAGGGLCDAHVVERVVREAPEHIAELVRWGTQFDREHGELVLTREGGHGHNRIVHALGDATGREVIRAMAEWTRKQRHIEVREHTFTIDLLTSDGECRGALVYSSAMGMMIVWAKQTILCTGGAGKLYRESTNPDVATADGHAIAYRAGAELRDMEFMQFHPTVLYIAGSSRSLITEAMRGEGGRLIDRTGERFMNQYDPRGELAPRDVVSQAIVTQMEKTRHPSVYLDMSHLDPEFVHNRFPGITSACAKFGIDITADPIPVRPGAHYMIGGATVDDEGQTTLPGLFAAGEVTSTGLHGANRLASNSLLEALVFGKISGETASRKAAEMPDTYQAVPIQNEIVEQPLDELESLDLSDIRNSLSSLMWRSVGVRREVDAMAEAKSTMGHWGRYVLKRQFDESHGWELQNLLTVSELVTTAAIRRRESRGVHLRTDFPAPNDDWVRRIALRRTDAGQLEVRETG